MPLTENRKQQLDGVVQQMISNQESDDNVQAVVDDFKLKYESEQPEQPKSIFRRTGEFLGDITGITGVAKGIKEAGRIGFAGLQGKPLPAPSITPK